MEMKRRWQDAAGLLLGAGLFAVPLMGLGPEAGLYAWNDYLFGVLIFVLSAMALSRPWLREEKVNILIGLWLIAAPFVLTFDANPAAMWTSIGAGLAIAIDALWGTRVDTPARHAH